MKLNNIFGVSFMLFSNVIAKQATEISVYELNRNNSTIGETINTNDAIMYFSDRLDISDNYELGNNKEYIKFVDERNGKEDISASVKAKLFVFVKGVKEKEALFESSPSFKINDKDSKLQHVLNYKVPKQISTLRDLEINLLSEELKFVGHNDEGKRKLVNHFKYFNEKLFSIWQEFKTKFTGYYNPNQIVFNEKKIGDASMLNVINDKLFINEFSQLIHLCGIDTEDGDFFIFDSNSLLSIGKKIGYNSKTYHFSKKLLSIYLQELTHKFDVTVLSMPEGATNELDSHLWKRNLSLERLFEVSNANKRSTSSCYTSQGACEAGTSSCSGHGSCISNKSGCWSCACSSSYNKSLSKTTYWTGNDCSKKDVSAETNLFLWSVISLLVLFVGSIQLLVKVGDEQIPGVLDAATIPKKNI